MAADVFSWSFPGIQQLKRLSFTLSGGTTPSVAMLEILPQPNLTVEVGPLVLTYNGLSLAFPDCHVNRFSFRRNDDGLIWALELWDRRWRWAFPTITGGYNFRNDDQTLDEDTEQTPQQLATLLLTAMGETGFDVSQLPNDLRPLVEWDHDLAAVELGKLCDALGCRPFLQLGGAVKICRLGVGAELPDLPTIADRQLGLETAPRPDKIRLVFGPTKVQIAFGLEAVGIEVDQTTVKPIDSLSYRPAGGWSGESVGRYTGVPNTAIPGGPPWIIREGANIEATTRRQLAIQTVFKWYRLSTLDAATARRLIDELEIVDGPLVITDREQFLPLLGELLDIDPITGKAWQPFIQGVYALRDGRWRNSSPFRHYRKGMSLDRERGIVQFGDYVFKWTQDGRKNSPIAGATLFLTAACTVRHNETWHFAREQREIGVPGPALGGGTRVIRVDEPASAWRFRYSGDANSRLSVASTLDNERDLDTEANFRLAAALREYELDTPEDVTYNGWLAIDPDGAIHQVTWTGEEGVGATTRASRNMEYSRIVPSYKERQTAQWLRDFREARAAAGLD